MGQKCTGFWKCSLLQKVSISKYVDDVFVNKSLYVVSSFIKNLITNMLIAYKQSTETG